MKKLTGTEVEKVKRRLRRLAQLEAETGNMRTVREIVKGTSIKYITAAKWLEKYREFYKKEALKKRILF